MIRYKVIKKVTAFVISTVGAMLGAITYDVV